MSKEKICGIYCIENILNNKKYIGQSIDIYSRWYQHKSELNRNSHCNDKFQKAWNKYGEDNFNFYIIEECCTDELDDIEQYYIHLYDSYYNGYNLDFGGTNKVRWTNEMKQKMSKFRLGLTEEQRQVCREAHKNEAIPIYQIDFEGNIVNKWEYGAREASKSMNINQSCIWRCLNKDRKTYKGYIWIIMDEYNENTFDAKDYITHKAKPNSYNKYDTQGNFIKFYSTYKDLEKDNLDPSGVLKCAKGKIEKYKGFIFKIA